MTAAAERRPAVGRALALEWFSLAWMLAEGGVSVGAGIAAGSLSLEAFGLDSLIELITAAVVLWRLRIEAASLAGGPTTDRVAAGDHATAAGRAAVVVPAAVVDRVAAAERRAARIVAGCLFALALYILISAAGSVRGRAAVPPDAGAALAGTAWGFAVAWAAVVVMPVLWAAKTRTSRVLASDALHEDGVGNLACGAMALLVVAGLAARRWGIWWADPLAALAIGSVVVREGWEAWERTSEGHENADGDAVGRGGGGSHPKAVRAYLGLGSNLGDRSRMLAQAIEALARPDLRVVRRSRIYETPPWGKTGQPSFLNQVIEVETALGPEALLARVRRIEESLGRVRAERWGPRTIDIDILLYADLAVSRPELTIPHAEMRRRAFVLVPLAEIAPGLRLPTGEPIEDLLKGLPDRDAVRPQAS